MTHIYNLRVVFTSAVLHIGILEAFIQLVEKCQTKYFIFCENDWYLIENNTKCKSILGRNIYILQQLQRC